MPDTMGALSSLMYLARLIDGDQQILLLAGFCCGHVSDSFQGGPVGRYSRRPLPEEYPTTGW